MNSGGVYGNGVVKPREKPNKSVDVRRKSISKWGIFEILFNFNK